MYRVHSCTQRQTVLFSKVYKERTISWYVLQKQCIQLFMLTVSDCPKNVAACQIEADTWLCTVHSYISVSGVTCCSTRIPWYTSWGNWFKWDPSAQSLFQYFVLFESPTELTVVPLFKQVVAVFRIVCQYSLCTEFAAVHNTMNSTSQYRCPDIQLQ